MSVLTDPATYGILNSELTNCPRTAAVLGEFAAQWQQMMGALQRVEQEAVSSQSPANAIENIGRTRIDATAGRLRLKDGERLYPKSWSGSTPIGGFVRAVAAWLGYVDPKHEAGKLVQRITKGTLRATETWTDGRHAEDDKHVELDCELAVALANATEGAARATVLRITQTEPSHGFVAWQALVDGYAPKSSNDLAIALQPILATPKRCKVANELMERVTAWPFKVAEYENQIKTIDESQKIFAVREMMPKDIKREFLTGPRNFDEITENVEIIANEMMADDGPVPMDLGSVGVHDTKTTQSDSDTSSDMSYEDVCAIAWKGNKAGKGAGTKGPNRSGTWHRGKGADEWPSGRRDDGGKKRGKKGSKGSKPDWHSDKDIGSKGKGKGKSETRYCYDCGEQGHIGVNCPYKWANSKDEGNDHTSSWESETGGENAEELLSLETPDEEGEWCWPEKRVTRWGRRTDSRPAFHYLAEDDEDEQASRRLNHLVSRSATGTQWTWKKVTVVVDSGAVESVMPRSMFPRDGHQANREVQEWKMVQGIRGENIKNYGQQVMSVRTPEGYVRKSTWQVADVRRPLVSASHVIQVGNDLFFGKDEAYIMNRKKKEMSMLSKYGNVCVLDLFVRVPPSVTVPVTYTPMEVDAINQVADGREPRRRVTLDCNSPTF